MEISFRAQTYGFSLDLYSIDTILPVPLILNALYFARQSLCDSHRFGEISKR